MRLEFDRLKTNWLEVRVRVRNEEIPILISRLEALLGGVTDHFHLRNSFSAGQEVGIADIEVSLLGSEEIDNAKIE